MGETSPEDLLQRWSRWAAEHHAGEEPPADLVVDTNDVNRRTAMGMATRRLLDDPTLPAHVRAELLTRFRSDPQPD